MNQLEFNKKNKSIGFTGLVANIFSGNRQSVCLINKRLGVRIPLRVKVHTTIGMN